MKEKFIKIPADFKSLHDLGELVTNYKFANKLISLLNGYQEHYVDSYLMSMEDILKTIPTDRQELYTIKLNEGGFSREISIYNKESRVRIKLDKMLEAIDSGDDKIYLINHQDKIIDICFWGSPDEEKYMEDKYYYWDFGQKLKNPIWHKGTYPPYSDYKYKKKDKFTFKIDDNDILILKVKYSYTADQSVGGYRFGGRISGATSVPYTINGHHIYHFCTKTNKYLGYKGVKEDAHRKWAETKSQY